MVPFDDPRAGRRHPGAAGARGTAGRSATAGLTALAGDTVAAAVALEHGAGVDPEHIVLAAIALAEMTDALAVISDRLACELKTPSGSGQDEAIETLYRVRDALVTSSSQARSVHRQLTDRQLASSQPPRTGS